MTEPLITLLQEVHVQVLYAVCKQVCSCTVHAYKELDSQG